MGRSERYTEEVSAIKTLEAPIDYSQMAHLFKGADIKDFRTPYDTGSTYCPNLEIFSSVQQVNGFTTDKGRNIQFDKNGYATYKVTGKDQIGLNDVVKDYMTRRDGQRPTPQQVQQMVDKMVKDPANRISNPDIIRPGQTLRFPGPEQAQRVQRDNPQSTNRPTETYPPKYPSDRTYPPGLRPNDVARPEYAPNQKPMDHTYDDTIKKVYDTQPGPEGSRIQKWSGQVEDGHFLSHRTHAHGWERTDQRGNLISSETNYITRKNVTIPKEGGTTEDVKAMQVRADFNPEDGKYYYKVQTEDKNTIQYRKDKDGNAERFDPKTGKWNR